jgi:GntR family transcriptional regulator/MocR family aminotransferase
VDFQFTLDSNSPSPLHRQLYEAIRQAILRRELAAGQRLPSTRTLAATLGVSRATITTSFALLLSEGYLEAATGSGTFVCRELPEEMLSTDLEDDFARGEASETLASTTFSIHAADAGMGEKKLARSVVGWTGVSAQSTLAGELAAPPPAKNSLKLADRLAWYGNSLIERKWLDFADDEPEISFIYGRPDLEHFPIRQWNQLYIQHAKRRLFTLLDAPSHAQGLTSLRSALADYLSRSRALHCTAEQIIIVNGSQQGIDLVSRVLIDRGDLAGIEEPGYIGAQKSLMAQGAVLEPIEVDMSGIKVDELKRRFDGSSGKRLKMVYLTPSHQYPTGVVLALPRRLELLAWAQRTGTFLIEDDYDSEYRYRGRPIPALAGLDKGDSVIYIGTFSKVLLPALRLGYLVVPKSLAQVFARAKWLSDRHSPLLEQQVLTDFIRLGHMDRHMRRMRNLYEQKRKLVIATMQNLFGERAAIFGDNAGINVLVRLQTELSDEQVVSLCRQRGVGLKSTRDYYLKNARQGEFVLNYGGLSDGEIVDGLGRISEVVHMLA